MSYQVVKKFVDRVRQSARTPSKQFVMSMDDAQDLANEIAILLMRENELLKEINELKSANQITEVVLGGGSFK